MQVRFEVTTVNKLPSSDAALIKQFKLTGSVAVSNLVAFDSKNRIKRYGSAEEILKEFYDLRLGLYRKRKQFLTNQLEREYVKLDNKVNAMHINAMRAVDSCAVIGPLHSGSNRRQNCRLSALQGMICR